MDSKVMVVGVGGVGHVVAASLKREGSVDEILAVDISERNLSHLKERLGEEVFSFHKVDASNREAMGKLMKDVDVVVNSAHYLLNDILTELSLSHGCHFISLTGGEELWVDGGRRFREMVEIHRKKDEEWRKNGLLGVLGLGEDPGLSNLFARHLSEKMDEVYEIAIRDADTVLEDKYVIAPLWSREELLLSSIAPAVYYENGEFKRSEPLSVCQEYCFPEPIGEKTLYLKEHPEVWTLAEFLPRKAKKITFWYNYDGISAQVIKALWNMGLLSQKKVKVKGVEVRPFDLVVEILPQPLDLVNVSGFAGIEVEVTGVKDEIKISMKMMTYISHQDAAEKLGVNGTSYLVGVPAAVGASAIVEGELKERGLLYPEQLNPKPFIEAIPRHGLPLIIEERRVEEVKPP